MSESTNAMQDDMLDLLRALGLSDHARPISPHRVMQDEILPAVAALTAENAQLRETLTLGLGEQESVIAGLRAENEILRRALIAHRADLHNGSSRPCPTCYQSAHALGIVGRVPNRCALADADAAALPSSRETTDGRTDPS